MAARDLLTSTDCNLLSLILESRGRPAGAPYREAGELPASLGASSGPLPWCSTRNVLYTHTVGSNKTPQQLKYEDSAHIAKVLEHYHYYDIIIINILTHSSTAHCRA